MKVKVFEIVKSGLSPLSEEMNDRIEIISTSQSQHLRENTVFVTIFYKPANGA
jgi:phospholipid N-methyltransferase